MNLRWLSISWLIFLLAAPLKAICCENHAVVESTKHDSEDEGIAGFEDLYLDGEDWRQIGIEEVHLALEDRLGRSKFGGVFRARFFDKDFAVKVIEKTDQNSATIENELDIYEGLSHPNIVAMHHQLENSYTVYLIMEKMDCNLFRYVYKNGKLKPYDAIAAMAKVNAALEYLHAKKIVYRDMKPENILIGGNLEEVRICDFDLSRQLPLRSSSAKGVAGTIPYFAPEMLLEKSCGLKADVYGLGGVAFFALYGRDIFQKNPFRRGQSEDAEITKRKIVSFNANKFFIYLDPIDPDLSRLLKLCLQSSPEKRPTSFALGEEMESLLEIYEAAKNDVNGIGQAFLDTNDLPVEF